MALNELHLLIKIGTALEGPSVHDRTVCLTNRAVKYLIAFSSKSTTEEKKASQIVIHITFLDALGKIFSNTILMELYVVIVQILSKIKHN